MARDSKMTRKLRRVRRERSLAFRMLEMVTAQRDTARLISAHLEKELKRRDEEVQLHINEPEPVVDKIRLEGTALE
jgi:hypothetical protein